MKNNTKTRLINTVVILAIIAIGAAISSPVWAGEKKGENEYIHYYPVRSDLMGESDKEKVSDFFMRRGFTVIKTVTAANKNEGWKYYSYVKSKKQDTFHYAVVNFCNPMFADTKTKCLTYPAPKEVKEDVNGMPVLPIGRLRYYH